VGIGRKETREARRVEMLGIALVGMRLAIPVEIVREGMRVLLGLALVELRREILEGIGLREMREGVDLQAITRGLRGILMRDFRRGEIGRRLSRGLSHSRNRGLRLSLSNDLSRGRRRQVRDRVGLAGITMPERRGRRAIAVEPVQVAVAETGEVETNETS
jgi:hypothetical protein